MPRAARHRPSPSRGHLFVVSAPSGAGKTSLIQSLVDGDGSLTVSVSHTTRPRRPDETDGVHYHFVDDDEFRALRDAGEFLESAQVFDNAYGTSRQTVLQTLESGGDVILEIDWQGAAQVRASWPDAVSIFVLPPSRQALIERLTGRGQDSPEVIDKRSCQAVEDMSHHGEFDHTIVNDDFARAVRELQRIVHAARDGTQLAPADNSGLLDELLGGDDHR